MAGLFGGGTVGKDLPRPQASVALLRATGVLSGLAGVAAGAWIIGSGDRSVESLAVAVGCLLAGLVVEGLCLCIALIAKYAFSAALSAKLTERTMRDILQKTGGQAAASEPVPNATHEEVVSLLSEIMENTLLDEKDKSAKRASAKRQRQQALRREIEALIDAARFREATERLENYRGRYQDQDQVAELESRLEEARHRQDQTEVATITEQVQKYMGLGLWERALQMARHLAEQYPDDPDAVSLPETVRMEQEAGRRQEEQRVYREIEHLVNRKHWRPALEAAERLLADHPDSPEAAKLREQLDELRRNADIAERREWEGRITEHVQAGRHREAYELAVELMAKYPDSPQAAAIRERLDQLKIRAGVTG